MNTKLMTLGALVALVAIAPAATAYHITGTDCNGTAGTVATTLNICGDPLNWGNTFSLTYGPCPPLVPFPGLQSPPVPPFFAAGDLFTIFPIACGDVLLGLILCEHQGFLADLIGGIIPGVPPGVTGDFSTEGNGGICNASDGHTDTMADGAFTDCEFAPTAANMGRSNGNRPNYDNMLAPSGAGGATWGDEIDGADDDCSPMVDVGFGPTPAAIPADERDANWVQFSLNDGTLGNIAQSGGQFLGIDCVTGGAPGTAGNLVTASSYIVNEQDLYIRDPHVGLFANDPLIVAGSYEVAAVGDPIGATSCEADPENFYFVP